MTTLVEQPRRPDAASCATSTGRRAAIVAPGAGLDCTDHKFYQWPITQRREADRALLFPIPHFARAYEDVGRARIAAEPFMQHLFHYFCP